MKQIPHRDKKNLTDEEKGFVALASKIIVQKTLKRFEERKQEVVNNQQRKVFVSNNERRE